MPASTKIIARIVEHRRDLTAQSVAGGPQRLVSVLASVHYTDDTHEDGRFDPADWAKIVAAAEAVGAVFVDHAAA